MEFFDLFRLVHVALTLRQPNDEAVSSRRAVLQVATPQDGLARSICVQCGIQGGERRTTIGTFLEVARHK
jgi:hypothetical protein